MFRPFPLLTALLALGACAQVPLADPRADQEGKLFDPPAQEKGALYIYRTGLLGIARPIDVAIAGGASAQLASNTYLRLEGPAGPVEVQCRVGDKTGGSQVEIRAGPDPFRRGLDEGDGAAAGLRGRRGVAGSGAGRRAQQQARGSPVDRE